MTTIASNDSTPIELGSGGYLSPLTVGSVASPNVTVYPSYQNYRGATAITGTTVGDTVTNYGFITGGTSLDKAVGGAGVSLIGGSVTNWHNITGGRGDTVDGYGTGGTGVILDGGSLNNYSSSHNHNGNISGGIGVGSGFSGGVGLDATNATIINGAVNGAGGVTGTIDGGHGEEVSVIVNQGGVISFPYTGSANGGIGVIMDGGALTNNGGSTIVGGTVDSLPSEATGPAGTAGVGVKLLDGATLSNVGSVAGGQSTDGIGAVAVEAYNNSVITNQYSIKGGYGPIATSGGKGQAGVVLHSGSSLTNDFGATITGGNLGSDIGGVGLYLTGGLSHASNSGTIEGGSSATQGGTGAIVEAGSTLTIKSAPDPGGGTYHGVVKGGAPSGAAGTGGIGVYLNGGTVVTAGYIEGGLNNFTAAFGDAIQFGPATGGEVDVSSGAQFKGVIDGFRPGDLIHITDLSLSAFDTTAGDGMSTDATGIIVTTTNDGTLQFDSTFSGENFQIVQDSSNTGIDIKVTCYLQGTRILTERGEQPIETLRIGDRVRTVYNGLRPIRWIGRRSYPAALADGNRELLPVRIRRGALGERLPKRDLLVSPEHALLIDGNLFPAEALINGVSIVQDMTPIDLTYYHLEFESHDAIYAEDAPAESFVDDESRLNFDNAEEYWELYPSARPEAACFCAPRVEDGEILESVRKRLLTLYLADDVDDVTLAQREPICLGMVRELSA